MGTLFGSLDPDTELLILEAFVGGTAGLCVVACYVWESAQRLATRPKSNDGSQPS
jgi:hypothetical protein